MSETKDPDGLKSQLHALRSATTQSLPSSPLVLAFIGDAVYELAVRTRLTGGSTAPVRTLHRRTADYVRASAQAKAMENLGEWLTEEEHDIVRRARNAKSNVPRSATVFEYRYSTAFEALFGHLFLTGQMDRLMELLNHVLPKEDTES